MVALLSFGLGAIVTILIMLARSSNYPQRPPKPRLPDLRQESQGAEIPRAPLDSSAPWERDSDWWR